MLYVRSNTPVLKRHSCKPYFSPIATKNIILRSRACEQLCLERGECKRGQSRSRHSGGTTPTHSPSLPLSPPHPTNSAATARKLMVFSLHLGVVSCHQVPKTLPLNATMAASERRSVRGGLVLTSAGPSNPSPPGLGRAQTTRGLPTLCRRGIVVWSIAARERPRGARLSGGTAVFGISSKAPARLRSD